MLWSTTCSFHCQLTGSSASIHNLSGFTGVGLLSKELDQKQAQECSGHLPAKKLVLHHIMIEHSPSYCKHLPVGEQERKFHQEAREERCLSSMPLAAQRDQ